MKKARNRRIKILILDNSPNVTGALKSITNIVHGLSPKYYEYLFVTPSDKVLTWLNERTIKGLRISFLELQKNWKIVFYIPMLIYNTFQTLSIIRKEQIEVIHVNDLYNMIGVCTKIIKPDIKLVYHVRLLPQSYVGSLYKSWVKLIYSYADHIICVSQAVKNSLPSNKKATVIYDAAPAPRENKLEKLVPFTFLYVGNYIQGKGQHYALEAFRLKQRDLEEAQLLFVGGDLGLAKNIKYKTKLMELSQSYGLSERVKFVDFNNNLSDYYQQSQVVINFSVSESFSMVCLESLLNGTPVIATKCGGPEEIIKNGENGLLVENKNIESMASAMVTIYQNSELRSKLSENTRYIGMKFSVDDSAARLSEIYRL